MEKNMRGFKLGIYTNALKRYFISFYCFLLFSIFSIIATLYLYLYLIFRWMQ